MRFVVTRGIIANIVKVTEQKWHRREARQTRAGLTEILIVRLFISLHVQQRIAVPHFFAFPADIAVFVAFVNA